MTLGEILNRAQKEFEDLGIGTALLDAEVLLAHAAGKGREWLYAELNSNVDENTLKHFENFVARRRSACPVAYITGVKEFWSIPIKVTPDVMIPRPETELVVEQALKICQAHDARRTTHDNFFILDLCAGSGCIAAALAREMPNARFTLVDKSAAAIKVARENLAFASGLVKFSCGDLFEAIDEKFDLIVSNPPYGALTELNSLAREITEYEPQMAIFGGKDGLDFIRRIIETAPRFLKPMGSLIMEIGIGQASKVKKFAETSGRYDRIEIFKDLAGIERVTAVTRNS